MKSGAEGAHFFGALLLTFSFDKHNYISKIICNICRDSNIVSCFAILGYSNHTLFYREPNNLILIGCCYHKSLGNVICNRPVMVDINEVTQANFCLSNFALFVNITDIYGGNLTGFYKIRCNISAPKYHS